MAAARKNVDKAWAHECAATLAWEKEKAFARHQEQQLTTAQGIMIP
jgi:hypothetical protein